MSASPRASQASVNVGGGVISIGLLAWATTAVLFVLKVCGFAALSWLTVFLPVILAAGGAVVLFLVALAVMTVVMMAQNRR